MRFCFLPSLFASWCLGILACAFRLNITYRGKDARRSRKEQFTQSRKAAKKTTICIPVCLRSWRRGGSFLYFSFSLLHFLPVVAPLLNPLFAPQKGKRLVEQRMNAGDAQVEPVADHSQRLIFMCPEVKNNL